MQRITISVDDDLLVDFDAYMTAKGYGNRSEAFRDLVRERLRTERLADVGAGDCFACLSFVYNHHRRQLARRLIEAQHMHHDLGVTTLHVHLDHDNCMEALILQGPADSVRTFADSIAAEGGVRHASLHVVPVETDVERHTHEGGQRRAQAHAHSRPTT